MSENKANVVENKCCFCHDECNPNSQACGRCMRSFNNDRVNANLYVPPNTPNAPFYNTKKAHIRRHSSDTKNGK